MQDLFSYSTREQHNQGRWVDIKFADKPVGLAVRLQGRYSDAFQRIARENRRQQQEQFRATGQMPILDPDEFDAKKLELVIECATEWRGPAVADRSFTRDGLKELCERHPQIVDQLDRALAEDADFLPEPSGNLASTPAPISGSTNAEKTAAPSANT